MYLNCYFKLPPPTRETQCFRNRALKQDIQPPPAHSQHCWICSFLTCWSQFTFTFSVTAALGQSPVVWDRTVRSLGTCCPLQARWGWLEGLAAWLELSRNPLTWQTATTDQSRLKSQRVFEVKSPDVQILAYSITCPSNINSLHQEYTYPVPQLTASHAGNFS